MAQGSVSYLGAAGTQLNSDLIDSLRKADEEALLKPLETNADKVIKQREDIASFSEKLKEIDEIVEFFSDELTYLKREVEDSGGGAKLEAVDGVAPQEGTIEVEQLAKASVVQSKGFATKETIVESLQDKNLTIEIDGENYDIEIPPGSNLQAVADLITEQTDGKVIGSIMNTGGDEPYSLVLKSKETGENQNINFGGENSLGLTTIQNAQDAKFRYNGIEVSRETNKVDDLISGVNFTLTEANRTYHFEIKEKLDGFTDKMEEFVKIFNEIATLADDISGYDIEKKEAGSFFGDSRINNITSDLIDNLFDKTVNGQNLTAYGLELTNQGKLTFNKGDFDTAFNENQKDIKAFFFGQTTIDSTSFTTGKIGYTKTPDEVRDGYTIPGVEVKISADATIPAGELQINGIDIGEVTLLASNTGEENARLVMNKINEQTSKTGVTAVLSKNGQQLIFSRQDEGVMRIQASDQAQQLFGVKEINKSGSSTKETGIFADLEKYMDDLRDGESSILGTINTELSNESKSIEEEEKKIKARLDSKYSTMFDQFVQYNSIIKQLENSFAGIQQQINAKTNNS